MYLIKYIKLDFTWEAKYQNSDIQIIISRKDRDFLQNIFKWIQFGVYSCINKYFLPKTAHKYKSKIL